MPMKRGILPPLVAGILFAIGLASAARPAALASPAEGQTVKLPAASVAGVAEGNPTLTFASSLDDAVTIGWNHRPEWGRRRAFVRFDLTQLPAGADIQRARLVAEIDKAAGLDVLVGVIAPVIENWPASQLTWDTQPARSADYIQADLGKAGVAAWDITDWARAWLTKPATNHGLALDSLADYPEDNERTLARFALEITLAADSTTLSLSIAERRDPVPAGEHIEYELVVHNNGAVPAIGPTLSANLSALTRFVWGSDGCSYSIVPETGQGSVHWTLQDLPAGKSYRVFLTVQIAPDTPAGSQIRLTADAQAANSARALAQVDTTAALAPSPTPTRPATPTATATSTRPPRTGTPTATRWPTATPTSAPTLLPCGSERVNNGDFESLDEGWTFAGESRPLIVAWPAHTGDFSALLGSSGFTDQAGDSIIRQYVRIPGDASAARLSFWYQIVSDEGDSRYDWFDAMILDAAGRTTSYLLKRGDSTSEWTLASFDATAYRGQTVQIALRVHNDGNAGVTLAYVDGVSLCAARPNAAEPTATRAAGIDSLAGAPDYAPAGMPDFSARQDDAWKSPGDAGWAFDGAAAAANVLWWLDSRREADDAPPPNVSDHYALLTSYGAWDDHAPENVPPLIAELASLADTDGASSGDAHAGARPEDLSAGLQSYLAQPQRDLAAAWEVLLTTAPSPGLIRQNAAAGNGIVLLLGFWQWDADGWNRLGGRYISVAGMGAEDDRLVISDPLLDAAELGRAGDVLPQPDHTHPAYPPYPPDAVHNDAGWASHDLYAAARVDGEWGLAGYALDLETITDSLGHNIATGQPAARPANPSLAIATRVEYAIILRPRSAVQFADSEWGTAAPVSSTLHLQLSEEGRPPAPHPSWSIPILITLQRPGDFAPSIFQTAQTDNRGAATVNLTLEPGQWELRARGHHTLGLIHPWTTLVAGDTNMTLHTLTEGDADADNLVAVTDLSLLAAAYGSSAGSAIFDQRVDFDEDRQIGPADIALWTRNQGRMGDTAVQVSAAEAPLQVTRLSSHSLIAAGGVGLTLYPSNTKTAVGRILPIQVRAESLEQEIDAAELHLQFDPTRLQIVNAAGDPVTAIQPAAAGPSTIIINRVDNQRGRIDFVAAQLAPPYPPTSVDLATFYVKAIAPTNNRTWLRFVTAPGRRSAVAYQGRDVTRVYYALSLSITGQKIELPLLYKRYRK